MARYRYTGCVKSFDKIISDNWTGETMAVSEAKARTNLAYRFKKLMGLAANAKISLPGKIELI